MKVPELEEKQGRNIYLSRPEYLSTILLPWSTASPYKKLLTLLTDQLQVLNFSLVQWQYTHILIIQYTKSIESRKDGLFWRCDGTDGRTQAMSWRMVQIERCCRNLKSKIYTLVLLLGNFTLLKEKCGPSIFPSLHSLVRIWLGFIGSRHLLYPQGSYWKSKHSFNFKY